jgi:hypothetical protein
MKHKHGPEEDILFLLEHEINLGNIKKFLYHIKHIAPPL